MHYLNQIFSIIMLTIVLLININCTNGKNKANTDKQYRWISVKNASLYSLPDFNSKKYRIIPYGAKIKIIKIANQYKNKSILINNSNKRLKERWYYITWLNYIGWIFGNFTDENSKGNNNKFNIYNFITNPFTVNFSILTSKNLLHYIQNIFGKPTYYHILRQLPMYDYSKLIVDKIYIQYDTKTSDKASKPRMSFNIYKIGTYEYI